MLNPDAHCPLPPKHYGKDTHRILPVTGLEVYHCVEAHNRWALGWASQHNTDSLSTDFKSEEGEVFWTHLAQPIIGWHDYATGRRILMNIRSFRRWPCGLRGLANIHHLRWAGLVVDEGDAP